MREDLESLCESAVEKGASFADARIVSEDTTSIVRQDSRADKLHQASHSGVGIRVLVNGAWGFSSVTPFDRGKMVDALEAALAMAKASSERTEHASVAELAPVVDSLCATCASDPRSVNVDTKMRALEEFELAAVSAGQGKIVNTIINYYDRVQRETIANSRGSFVENESVRTLLGATYVARDASVVQKGRARIGWLGGYEVVENTDPKDFTIKAAESAVSLLYAAPPPAGRFPVVFHPTITGLLTHEAIGHNVEADHVLNHTSIVEGKLGETIASKLVTIVDDPTVPNAWGSYKYDSEATPAHKRTLLENGVLKGYLNSLETAAKLGVAPNGCARAQSYDCRPIVRMSNTYIQPGTSTLEQMIAAIDLGVYLKSGEHGYVFCERGQFTCHAGEAYMIRDGRIAEKLRDVSVVGMTLETLANIDAVGDDFLLGMPGMCGKGGQGAPVDNGGPHIRIKELVVGGRA